MKESIDFKKIKQDVYWQSKQDGILEIWMGIFFLYYAVFLDNQIRGIEGSPPMFIFIIFISIFPIIHYKIIRNVFTYPRMGYVNVKEEITTVYAFTVILPLIILPFFIYIMVRFLGDSLNISLILKWVCVLFGLVFGALYYHFAKLYGKKRYMVLMVFSVIAGIVLSQIDDIVPSVSALLAANSIIIFLHGIFMLIRFIRKFPKKKDSKNIMDVG